VRTSTGLIVLGMHRSGTSAMSGVLALLGVDLGQDLMSPAADNVRGFWEHARLVEMNDRMLHVLGSSWHDLLLGADGWWDRQEVQEIKPLIREILAREFARSSLWAIKDPRLCRLLPAWRDLIAVFADRPRYLLVLRQPGEVARSLAKRNGLTSDAALLLWLQHVLQAERQTRSDVRVFVTYDSLLADWREVADRVRQRLDVIWPVEPERVARQVDEFINPGLRHHRVPRQPEAQATEAGHWADVANRIYQVLGGPDAPDAAGIASLDRAAEEIEQLFAGPNRQLSLATEERWSHWREHHRCAELRTEALARLAPVLEERDRLAADQEQYRARIVECQSRVESLLREHRSSLEQQAADMAAREAELGQERQMREQQGQQLAEARELWARTDRALAQCQALVAERTAALGEQSAAQRACEAKVQELSTAFDQIRRNPFARFLLDRRLRGAGR